MDRAGNSPASDRRSRDSLPLQSPFERPRLCGAGEADYQRYQEDCAILLLPNKVAVARHSKRSRRKHFVTVVEPVGEGVNRVVEKQKCYSHVTDWPYILLRAGKTAKAISLLGLLTGRRKHEQHHCKLHIAFSRRIACHLSTHRII